MCSPDDFTYTHAGSPTHGRSHDNPAGYPMGGYQMLVHAEIMRGRFRGSFEKPVPLTLPARWRSEMGRARYRQYIKKGHRLMIQIQSTWFPLVDSNPQKFVDIYTAEDSDFQKKRSASSTTTDILRGSSCRPKIISLCASFPILSSAILLLPPLAQCQRPPDPGNYVKNNYDKQEVDIPMRDGKHLYTVIYIPKDQTHNHPFLMERTPYGRAPMAIRCIAGALDPTVG